MADIGVTSAQPGRYRVVVREGDSRTVHDVGASDADVRRFGGDVAPEELIRASFEFLLEREPKESILRRFDLPVIARYFPEYPARIRAYL